MPEAAPVTMAVFPFKRIRSPAHKQHFSSWEQTQSVLRRRYPSQSECPRLVAYIVG
jgi:hypothetical protein